jgi:hypothetical protein
MTEIFVNTVIGLLVNFILGKTLTGNSSGIQNVYGYISIYGKFRLWAYIKNVNHVGLLRYVTDELIPASRFPKWVPCGLLIGERGMLIVNVKYS